MAGSFVTSKTWVLVRVRRLASASGEFLGEMGKTVKPALNPPMMVVMSVIESMAKREYQ